MFTELTSESICEAYPNPASSALILIAQSSADSVMFLLVNDNYILIAHQQKLFGSIQWSLKVDDRTKFKANNIYRVYYKLLYKSGKIEKGHGDIEIKDF